MSKVNAYTLSSYAVRVAVMKTQCIAVSWVVCGGWPIKREESSNVIIIDYRDNWLNDDMGGDPQ